MPQKQHASKGDQRKKQKQKALWLACISVSAFGRKRIGLNPQLSGFIF
jgi:hypothetical protein